MRLAADHPEVADRLAAVSDCAGQVGQHPARSWTRSRPSARAFDRRAVRPLLSASARISATPACDTIPVPPPLTFSPCASF
jgi:hypothetical protein